jgi:hypothetical protein
MSDNKQKSEDENLKKIVKNLGQINVPTDFNFQVNQRIEERKNSSNKFWNWKKFAFGVPILASVVILAFISLPNLSTNNENQTTLAQAIPNENVVTPINTTNSNSVTNSISTNSTANLNADKPKIEKTITEVKFTKKNLEPKTSVNKSSITNKPKQLPVEKKIIGGSKEFAASDNNVNIKPKGFNGSTEDELKGFLLTIGVETELEKGKYRVKKVSPESTGDRSGVKENDLIESANTETTSAPANTVAPKTVKSLKIKRDNKKVELPIKP